MITGFVIIMHAVLCFQTSIHVSVSSGHTAWIYNKVKDKSSNVSSIYLLFKKCSMEG